METFHDIASEDLNRFGIGANHPPSDEEILRQKLEEKSCDLRRRYDDLIASLERMPAVCESDDMAGKMGDMAKILSACEKEFEAQREAEKKPYLNLGRAVDSFYRAYSDGLEAGKKKVLARLQPFLRKKEEEARRAALEESRRQREEAERLAQEAASLAAAKMTQAAAETINEAARLDDEAARAARKAEETKASEFARTRGSYGSVATLGTKWVGEIISRDELDIVRLLPYLSLDSLQKALNAYVKAGNRELKGARIFEDKVARVN